MAEPEVDVENVNVVPAEDGTTWIEIASSGTEDEAQLLKGFLDAEGIPAQIEDVKFHMEPINFGTMGEIRVYVRAADETRALDLLRQREQEYQQLVDDDEETLVTDEGIAVIEDGAQAENDDGSNT
jgi:hypothetical protein